MRLSPGGGEGGCVWRCGAGDAGFFAVVLAGLGLGLGASADAGTGCGSAFSWRAASLARSILEGRRAWAGVLPPAPRPHVALTYWVVIAKLLVVRSWSSRSPSSVPLVAAAAAWLPRRPGAAFADEGTVTGKGLRTRRTALVKRATRAVSWPDDGQAGVIYSDSAVSTAANGSGTQSGSNASSSDA